GPAGTPMDAYDYGLPDEAIAQRPAEPRSAARLLVAPGVDGNEAARHARVSDLAELVRPGDVVVVNDTRVLAGRLNLVKASGGRAEVLLLEPVDTGPQEWEAMVRPGRRLPEHTLLSESEGGAPVIEVGRVLGGADDGRRLVRLVDPGVVERAGRMPLPPYLHGPPGDPERYQTVYATERGIGNRSAAAPTAGLHFTPELLEALGRAGATLARLDLTIGLDTFRPVTAPTAEEHVIHSERYSVPAETMAACLDAERVIAVGTTAVRALESAAATGSLSGRTGLYIHGPYPFRMVDLLVTNFHLPRSSLLLLVESFCGPVWRELYATALGEGYRFLSFGDAMVVGRSAPRGGRPAPKGFRR
ncbi:MAG TPA: S-adenosylmethionine:tRNA ribosyltransferase-isomerase, partial [Acidimicrobiales bacterium]